MKVTVTGIVAEPPPASTACTRAFAGHPGSVGAGRVTGFVPGSPAADDLALLTSELITNAILHSASRLPGGEVTVSVQAADGMVRVDVTNLGELPPRFPPEPRSPSGSGAGRWIEGANA
jgi:signal transduction histidine kinase